ncbi:MAG TPA: threonine/serine dehydratase, partial [Blastocatellia bacterium]|nr:threonine/serine dehydratase [Blastocatellia bacterium]
MSPPQVTIEDIRRATARIGPAVRLTPLERSRRLSEVAGRDVWLKLECFQTTGSFKIRGAMSRLAALDGAEKTRGVLTVSAGNHGLAVAHCAEELGLDAVIVVPRSASRAKVEAIRRYRVSLVEEGASYDEAERAAREMERESERVFVSPYNDPFVIAGQGTVALEMLEERPELDCLLVPVGGGGLIAGVAVAARAVKPGIKIYGVEPAASPTMTRSLEAGRIIEIEEDETVADGLAGNIEPGSITFPIIQRLVDEMILVDEEAIRKAVRRAAR